jgi:hypothetical protein
VKEQGKYIRTVLEVLLKAGLYLKIRMYEFEGKEVRLVEFIITLEEVSMEGDSRAAIEEWPMTDSHCNIQVFLVFMTFYKHFIKGLSRIVRPLTSMLKGSKVGNVFGPLEPITEM